MLRSHLYQEVRELKWTLGCKNLRKVGNKWEFGNKLGIKIKIGEPFISIRGYK
jgi:hypothetical protein